MTSFAEQITKFVAKTDAAMTHIVQDTIIELGDQVVGRSPVGKPELWKSRASASYIPGEFAGSWAYGFNADVAVTHVPTPDATGQLSRDRISDVRLSPAAGIHTIYNNAPYSFVMESGVHPDIPEWSLVEGNYAACVQLTRMEFGSIVDAMAARHK